MWSREGWKAAKHIKVKPKGKLPPSQSGNTGGVETPSLEGPGTSWTSVLWAGVGTACPARVQELDPLTLRVPSSPLILQSSHESCGKGVRTCGFQS